MASDQDFIVAYLLLVAGFIFTGTVTSVLVFVAIKKICSIRADIREPDKSQ